MLIYYFHNRDLKSQLLSLRSLSALCHSVLYFYFAFIFTVCILVTRNPIIGSFPFLRAGMHNLLDSETISADRLVPIVVIQLIVFISSYGCRHNRLRDFKGKVVECPHRASL